MKINVIQMVEVHEHAHMRKGQEYLYLVIVHITFTDWKQLLWTMTLSMYDLYCLILFSHEKNENYIVACYSGGGSKGLIPGQNWTIAFIVHVL